MCSSTRKTHLEQNNTFRLGVAIAFCPTELPETRGRSLEEFEAKFVRT
jgi:hypothetical protein